MDNALYIGLGIILVAAAALYVYTTVRKSLNAPTSQDPSKGNGSRAGGSDTGAADLHRIAEYLRAIRNMLIFFTVLALVGLLIQTCSALLSF